MRRAGLLPPLAGVDGCRAGWVAAVRHPDSEPGLQVFQSFRTLIEALPGDALVAVDMPIGLPDRIAGAGRTAEVAARAVLAKRRSSVFPIPARAAFAGPSGPFASAGERAAAYRRACETARLYSDRGTAFAIQAFGIFPKIKEIDVLLRDAGTLRSRVIEGHPEVAFAVLNQGHEMRFAKKAKTGSAGDGSAERARVLSRHGLGEDLMDRPLPPGVGRDDWLDACAMLLVAERYARGEATSYPDPPDRDAHGLPIAIWV